MAPEGQGEPRPVGVVTGLASEAAIVERLAHATLPEHQRPIITCAGASSRRAASLARGLVEQGVGALLSFGIAGGLAASARPGHLVMASSIFTPEHHRLPCDAPWRQTLAQAAEVRDLVIEEAAMAGSDRLLASARAKATLCHLSGAIAVDMESHAVAAVAWETKLPFVTLRAVADPASRGLPAIVHGAVDRKGRPRAFLVATRLVSRPWEWKNVTALRDDAQRAHRALESLGPIAPQLFGPPLLRSV